MSLFAVVGGHDIELGGGVTYELRTSALLPGTTAEKEAQVKAEVEAAASLSPTAVACYFHIYGDGSYILRVAPAGYTLQFEDWWEDTPSIPVKG